MQPDIYLFVSFIPNALDWQETVLFRISAKKKKKLVADYSVRKASLRQRIISRGDDGKDDNLGGRLMALDIK